MKRHAWQFHLSLVMAGCAGLSQAQGVSEALLPAVSVTATRVETSNFEVPASIDRVDRESIADGKPQINISESLSAVPGLQVRDRQNYAQDVQISIRGFGARSTFGIRGLRLYIDDIPATFPDGQGQISNVELGTVDSIEVLRGPFSALYGNSSGGVVSVRTQEGQGRPRVEFGLGVGSDGQQRESLKASGRDGALGYVLGASRFETDGYRNHSAAKRMLGNVKLTLTPDTDTKFTLVANTISMPQALDPLGLTRAQFNADPRAVDPSAITFDTRKSVEQTQAGFIVERRIDASNSVRALVYAGRRSTTQYQSIPVASQSSPLSPGGMIDLSSDYSGTDLRWTARRMLGQAPLTVVAGVAYDQLRQQRRGYQNFIGSGASADLGLQGALRRDEIDRASNFDQYVQGTVQLNDVWSVAMGLRHSSVRIGSQDRYIVSGNGDDSGSVTYGATLPVVGITMAVSEAVRLYATAGQGFETPTLNELAYQPGGATGLNFALQPARSNNVEAGVKTRLGDWGDLNAAVFLTRTRQEIVTLTNVAGRSTYQNAGSTQRSGLELGWSQRWQGTMRAQVAYTYLDASYRDGFLSCNASPCAAGSQTSVPAGNRIPGIARHTLYAAMNWTPPSGWRAGIDARFVSRLMVNDANSDAAPGVFVVGASAGYLLPLGSWTLSSFVRADNLFARRYAGSVIVNDGNGRYFEPAPGRTWFTGVSAAYSF